MVVKSGGHYVDCTLGGGGHAAEIIRQGGRVLGLDQDPQALLACPDLAGLTKVHSNFIRLAQVVRDYSWAPVEGVLLDLGLSAYQVATPARGFSFQEAGPLDMRMDPGLKITAATLVNRLSVDQLARMLSDFGEIPPAKSLAAKIVAARPLSTTDQLAKVTGRWSRQAFQALRIAVNDELGVLAAVLPAAWSVLDRLGRLVVISFHSLEDRLVKRQFAAWQGRGWGQVLTKKPVLGERGAKLRAIVKL